MPAPQPRPDIRKTVLPNGIRVVTERVDHVDSVALGLSSVTGSRSDPPGREGTVHFLEHLLFKGTASRTARQIAEVADDIGGNVNGLTDREELYLYARTTSDHTRLALELLLDLLLNSLCGEEEVAREREVVSQELANVQDDPEEWMQEMVPPTVWPDHPLGRALMGTPDTVSAITAESLRAFLSDRMQDPARLVVVAAGRVEHDLIVEIADRSLGRLLPRQQEPDQPLPRFHSGQLLVPQAGQQVHFCRVSPGIPRTDDTRHTFAVLETLLGGGSSSRLFQEIRENRGLAYDIGSYLMPFRDAGLFVITGGAAPGKFQLVLDLVEQEVARLRAEPPSPDEVARAKVQIKTSLALAAESMWYRMHHLSASEIYWGRPILFDEIAAGVERVTAEDVHQLSQTALAPDGRAVVAIGPVNGGGG
ncbi:MAG: M16 family metallopeptidase [Armatimonadota bacterium]